MASSSMPATSAPDRLDRRSLQPAVRYLAREDRDLAAVVRRHGPPPLWARRPGVATLVQIILEQQVSLASARAVYREVRRYLEAGARRFGSTRTEQFVRAFQALPAPARAAFAPPIARSAGAPIGSTAGGTPHTERTP